MYDLRTASTTALFIYVWLLEVLFLKLPKKKRSKNKWRVLVGATVVVVVAIVKMKRNIIFVYQRIENPGQSIQ
jgi:hypothetical protein